MVNPAPRPTQILELLFAELSGSQSYHPFVLLSWATVTQHVQCEAGLQAKTINPGAYFRVVFSGESCSISTDTSKNVGLWSQFWTRVDGGPLVQHVLTAGNPTFKVRSLLRISVAATVGVWSACECFCCELGRAYPGQ
jgi:hypothetical protein